MEGTPRETHEQLVSRIRTESRRAARIYRLPSEDAEDCAQEVYVRLREEPDASPVDERIRTLALRIAAVAAKRKRARGRTKPPKTSLPPLCPRLARLADGVSDRTRFLKTLFAAACRVAHEPAVLRTDQLRVFLLVYEDRRRLHDVRGLLGIGSDHAIRARLRRISNRLEQVLTRRLQRIRPNVLSHADARTLNESDPVRSRGPAIATPPSRRHCVLVEEALLTISGLEAESTRPGM